MSFIVNNSPLAGTEGDKVTSRMIRDRLLREAEGNVALRVDGSRRQGFDGSLRPRRIAARDPDRDHAPRRLRARRCRARASCCKKDEATGELLEPIEEVVIDVDEEHSGVVVQKMSERKAEMIEMRPSGGNRLRLVFYAPTRGLIGYQGELLTDTRGTAIMNRLFHDYAPYKGDIQGRRNGVLISNDQGEAVAYAMCKLEDRGPMMIEPGWKVYQGMIVGEHTRDNDLEVNVLKGKQLTNIRTTSQGRGGAPDPADPHDAGKGAGLYRGRRAGRGDAEVDPPAQEVPRPQRPQARGKGQGSGGVGRLSIEETVMAGLDPAIHVLPWCG